MPTLNDRVVAAALADVGRVIERPLGANDDGGGPITSMEAYWRMRYEPWCGMACSRWLRSVPGVTDVAHPSTWEIVQQAKRKRWVTNRPVPGALIVWPPEGGKHVEMIVEVLDSRTVATVGGNVSDRTQRKVRSLAGATLVVSPELRNGTARQMSYWLEDAKAQPRLVGPWRTEAQRQKALKAMKPAVRATARMVTTPKGRKAILIGPRRLFGPWPDADQRNDARRVLERRLGRTLRPFAKPAPATTPKAESLGKTT
jgi:hypothetical protein